LSLRGFVVLFEVLMNHFISIADCTREQLRHMLDVAAHLKKEFKSTGRNQPLRARWTANPAVRPASARWGATARASAARRAALSTTLSTIAS
jgi:aspartate carbamoyltransferase catalytic subunit